MPAFSPAFWSHSFQVMTAQSAIFDPIPDHARHLFFDLNPDVDPRAALHALAEQCDGQSAVLGIGPNVT